MTIAARPPRRLPAPWLVLACWLTVAALLWPFATTDFTAFLRPWFDHLRVTGPLTAFSRPFSDYAPPYLYLLAGVTRFASWASTLTLVKLVSVGGTLMLGMAMWSLLRAAGAPQPARAAMLMLLWPTVALNALLLTQCDALYTAAAVMMVAATVRERPRAALAWFGTAVAIKAQGAFIGPFLLAWLLSRGVPLRWWLIAPLTTLALWLPAAAAGWPPLDLATVYLRQGNAYPALALNAPTFGQILMLLPGIGMLPLKVPLLAAAAGAAMVYVIAFSIRLGRKDALLAPALLAVLIVVGLLPMMHERYFFLADVLALAQALVRRDRGGWAIAWGVEAGSLLALLAYLTGNLVLAPIGAAVMLLTTAGIVRSLRRGAVNDEAFRPSAATMRA